MHVILVTIGRYIRCIFTTLTTIMTIIVIMLRIMISIILANGSADDDGTVVVGHTFRQVPTITDDWIVMSKFR